MNPELPQPPRIDIPSIIPIGLKEAARRQSAGDLSEEQFQARIQRLSREELLPRGLSLLVRELAAGHTRFLIKGRRGEVCDMIECNGSSQHPLAA